MLDGKVAIITGAGRGLGRSHALLMAQEGAKIVVNDVGSEWDGSGKATGPADDVVKEIKAAGGDAVSSFESEPDLMAIDMALGNVQTQESHQRGGEVPNNGGLQKITMMVGP